MTPGWAPGAAHMTGKATDEKAAEERQGRGPEDRAARQGSGREAQVVAQESCGRGPEARGGGAAAPPLFIRGPYGTEGKIPANQPPAGPPLSGAPCWSSSTSASSFKRRRPDDYRLLNEVRRGGDREGWTAYFLPRTDQPGLTQLELGPAATPRRHIRLPEPLRLRARQRRTGRTWAKCRAISLACTGNAGQSRPPHQPVSAH